MSHSQRPSDQANLLPNLPQSVGEVRACLQNPSLLTGWVARLELEAQEPVRWAQRQPLCARELVETLFSKKKLDQAVAPFFTLCAKDPLLKKALLRIVSSKTAEKTVGALERNIEALASHPELFFALGKEALENGNHRLAIALLAYCDKNPEFIKAHLPLFFDLIKLAVHSDVIVLGYIIDQKLDRFLEEEGKYSKREAGLDLGKLMICQRWEAIDVLIRKGRISSMEVSRYELEEGKNLEKIDLMIANGAIVSKPPSENSWIWIEPFKRKLLERAYARFEMRKALHAEGLTVDNLRSLNREDLWRWLALDYEAPKILNKHPEFFVELLLEQSKFPDCRRILTAYKDAGIFQPIAHGIPLLFRAIASNDCGMAKALIEQGVPADATDPATGWSVLEAALRSDQLDFELFAFLLDCPNVDCRRPFKEGVHPIDLLSDLKIVNKHVFLKALFAKGLSIDGAKLSLIRLIPYLEPFDVPFLKLLISQGLSLDEQTRDGDTVLHVLISSFASAAGFKRQVLLELMQQVAASDPKRFDGLKNANGNTLLDLAIQMDLPDVLLTLLQTGFTKRTFMPPQGANFNLLLILSAYEQLKKPDSLDALRPWLNLTNFEYFFGDAINTYQISSRENTGKPGNSFVTSAEFLVALLSLCEVEAVKNASLKLERAVVCAKLLERCQAMKNFKRRFLPVLCSALEAQIAALPAGQSLLMPSGWDAKSGSYHAMLLEVKKNPDGTLSLLVINTDTGNGALRHAVLPKGLKDLINPIRAFNGVPQEKLFESGLISALFSLLAHVPEDGANAYSDKDYYHQFFSRFSEYAAPLPPDRKGCFITAQRSGTCTIRCALAWLHVFLGPELYSQVKLEMEKLCFTALDNPEFIDKACINPEFLRHLEHAIERCSQYQNKHKEKDPDQAEKFANLLSAVDKKIAVAAQSEGNFTSVEEAPGKAESFPLQMGVESLTETRKKLFDVEVKPIALAPCRPLALPFIDFSTLSSPEEWLQGFDQLNAFYQESAESLMDPHQTIATRLTTQTLSTLALPNEGVYHPEIDAGTPMGSLSLEQKMALKEKLGALCQNYATALYNQRMNAAKKENHLSFSFYGRTEPSTEAESVEEYLGQNLLFAYYWRVCLALENSENQTTSLSSYGIDVSHLTALKNSIHLPCYTPQTASRLDALIAFFEKSHPSPGSYKRTLLGIGSWAGYGNNFHLPNKSLKGLLGGEEKQGENLFFEEWYQKIPEESWKKVDQQRDNLPDWVKPDQKHWRLAHLFAHPELFQSGEHQTAAPLGTLCLYDSLRRIAFTCWLFKRASHKEPVSFGAIKYPENSIWLELEFKVNSKIDHPVIRAIEAKDPFQAGKLGHSPVDKESAFLGTTDQNTYIINEFENSYSRSRRFYEIAEADEFSIYRLLSYYKEHSTDLKRRGDQTFFQLILFGKERLARTLTQDPRMADQILHLIDQALHEFALQLAATPTQEDLHGALIFLNALKLRLSAYLPNSFSENQKLALQKEISERLETATLTKTHRAELLLLWICAMPETSWSHPQSCMQALAYLAEFELVIEKLERRDYTDPTLKALAYRTVFAHLQPLKEVFAKPEALSQTAKRICRLYGIEIAADTSLSAAFPQLSFVQDGHLYEIHLLSGIVVRDKICLARPIEGMHSKVLHEFSRNRETPLELHFLDKGENVERYYALSSGREYSISLHTQGSKEVQTQIEWSKGSDIFCYLPFSEVPEALKKIALKSPYKEYNYHYWVSKGDSPIAAIIQNQKTGIEEVIIFADGTTERVSSPGRWNYLAVSCVPEVATLAALAPKEQIAVWERADGSDEREMQCFGLRDSKGNPLILEGNTITNLPGYHLCREQTVKGLGRHFPYAIVENDKGRKKALIPLRTWSETTKGHSDPCRTYSYEEIAIDEKGYPAPSGIEQRLLLAYLFIGAKQFERALGLLKQIDSSRVYTPKELKMFGWVFLVINEMRDHSPKAVSLSLMAALLVKKNLDNFPDAYPAQDSSLKLSSYYEDPEMWTQFWKGTARFENPPGEPEFVDIFVAKALTYYYAASSHCTPDFQIHGKLLTPFQEAAWLKSNSAVDFMPSLEHRLHFLLKGQAHPAIEEAKPEFEIGFKFAEEMTGFDWMHSINLPPEAYRDVLSSLDRIRPENGLKKHFGKLFALATKGSQEERDALLLFLKDMQHDPQEVNQLIRALLISQLPLYTTAPGSALYDEKYYSNEKMTLSQQIEAVVARIATRRHNKNSSALSTYEGWLSNSDEKTLTKLLHQWKRKFFPPANSFAISTAAPEDSDICSLLPPLSEKKTEKMAVGELTEKNTFIEEMNSVAEAIFKPEEKSASGTAFPPLPPTLEKDPYYKMRGDALRQDIEKGKKQNRLKTRFALKEEGLDQLIPLEKDLQAKRNQMKSEVKDLGGQIEDLARQVRGGSNRELEAQLRRLGKRDLPPTLEECIALCVQGDLALYQKRLPYLTPEDCHHLHTLIARYLLAATTEQRLGRSIQKLDKVLSRSRKGKSLEAPLHNLAMEMKNQREFNPSEHPEMLVLEYFANISMRKEQCKNLIKMTTTDAQGRFPPVLLQMIMNAGKTSVVGTLLALLKADGFHLSLLFIPQSLLASHGAEAKERNQSFFGQRGDILTFNRGRAHFNVPHLLRLQEDLLNSIEDKRFKILTPETLLGMQNQYIEGREKVYALRQQQLDATPTQRKKLEAEIAAWEAPTQELKKILRLIRLRGAATRDEIDAQDSPRKELNYPGIETTKLDRISIELVSALYEIASTDLELKAIGLNLAENTQSRLIPDQMEQIKPHLAKKMLAAIQASPLWCQHLGLGITCDPQMIQELTDYFINPFTAAPEWLVALSRSTSEADRMAAERVTLIRQEISEWLPSCWTYSANEHFGRSRENPQYLAAKPNICASTPNETAEIAHPWELVNKTLQLYVATGVDLEQTKNIVDALQKLALIQRRKLGAEASPTAKQDRLFDKTPAVQSFKKAVLEACGDDNADDLELMKLSSQNNEAMKKVQKVLNARSPEGIRILLRYLSEQVFTKLEFHRHQIHNNSANISGAVSSEQGYSGTTANAFIFSYDYLQDPEKRIIPDKGAYGRVIDTLCSSNRTMHTVGSRFKRPKDLMRQVHQPKNAEERNLFHAFIDIGAYFKEHTNAEVAASFLSYFSKLEASPIEGVLYYDANNQLTCLRKGKDPIRLDSTDAKTIFAMTGLKKQQLFTFYDQFHTVGSNIIQDPHAKAFYTIGDQTVLRDELQGGMRMRGLLEEQEIEGLIPEDLIPLIENRIEQKIGQTPSIEQILLFGEVSGLLKDATEDNLKAFSIKLNAAVRKYVLDKQYDCSLQEEEALYAVARSFFIKPMSEELFSRYGGVPSSVEKEKYITAVLRDFDAKIALIKPHLPDEMTSALTEELQGIASIAKVYLSSRIDNRSLSDNNTVEKIADIDKKVDTQNELETLEDLERNKKLQKAQEIPWKFDDLNALLEQLHSPISSEESKAKFSSVSEVMSEKGDYILFSDAFTPQFLVSRNFIETVSDQTNLFESLQKTPYETLLFSGQKGKLHLLLLTTKEAIVFFEAIGKYKEKCPFVLLNADGSFRAGAPIDLTQPEAEHLIIQMLFFSGRLSQLEEQKWEEGLNRYFSTDRAIKRDLFETVLLESRKLPEYEHSRLKQLLNAPSSTVSTANPVFTELKTAFFGLKRGHRMKCRETVEKHFGSLGKDDPEAICTVIDIARNASRDLSEPTHLQWGIQTLRRTFLLVQDCAENKEYTPLERMIEALKGIADHEIKTQIVQRLVQIPEIPFELLKSICATICQFTIDEKTPASQVAASLRDSMHLLNHITERTSSEELTFVLGEQLIKTGIPQNTDTRGYGTEPAFNKSHVLFGAILTLMRETDLTDPLFKATKSFLTKYLESWEPIRQECLERWGCNPSSEKALIEFYEGLSEKCCGIYPELDDLLTELLLKPLIQRSYKQNEQTKEYSDTEASRFWMRNVKLLDMTKIPYALEQAENLRLKFEKENKKPAWF